MLLGLAAVMLMVIIWLHYGPEPQLSTKSTSAVSAMTEVPPRISQLPSITYRITRWDLFFNNMTLWMRNRILQLMLVLFLGFELWFGLSRYPGHTSALELAFHCLVILVSCVVIMLVTFVFVGLAMSFLLKQRGVICEHVLEITDEGLVESTEMNRTLHRWSSICRIMNIFGYLFVYVGDQNAHQVPRRCIPLEQMANFERELRARTSAAR